MTTSRNRRPYRAEERNRSACRVADHKPFAQLTTPDYQFNDT